MSTDLESLPETVRREVVARWIRLNIAYATARLERGSSRPEAWETWKSFHEHALAELDRGDLDPWIRELHDPAFDPTSTDRSSRLPPIEGPSA